VSSLHSERPSESRLHLRASLRSVSCTRARTHTHTHTRPGRFDPARHPDGPDLQELLSQLLRPVPRDRLSAAAALRHPWLADAARPCAVPPGLHAYASRRGPAEEGPAGP
jgi:serine/threonine protein kinase